MVPRDRHKLYVHCTLNIVPYLEVIRIYDSYSQIGLKNIFNSRKANFYGILEFLSASQGGSIAIDGPNLYIDRVAIKSVLNVTQHGAFVNNPKATIQNKHRKEITIVYFDKIVERKKNSF